MIKYRYILIVTIILVSFVFPKCYSGNCENGRGAFLESDGTKYIGQFEEGRYQG